MSRRIEIFATKRTRYPGEPSRAVVGANASAHAAGIHQDGMLNEERTHRVVGTAR